MTEVMKTELTSVCTIILAYGARSQQLQKVLAGVFEQGTGHVIVVANAVINETNKMLVDLKKTHPGHLEILPSDENLGSSGGYALGLSTAINKSYEYFWLLDDDNLPKEGALPALLSAFSLHQQSVKRDKLVLQSFRESLPEMMEIFHNKCQPSLPRAASFIGFHIFNLWETFYSILSTKNPKASTVLNNEKDAICLHSAPYGGLFFHRDAIKTLGIPDPLFFLYADDLAYTLNFTLKGGSLLLVPDSRIIDIEPVWNATGDKTSNIYRRLKVLSSKKTYYEVRNRVYVGRMMFPGHPLMYWLNKWVYITLLALLASYYSCGDRFKLILRAARDGEQGRLGKRNFENET